MVKLHPLVEAFVAGGRGEVAADHLLVSALSVLERRSCAYKPTTFAEESGNTGSLVGWLGVGRQRRLVKG